MRVHKPIFVIGTGRSGSTVFHDMLAHHPNVAWLSGLCDKNPATLSRNRILLQVMDYPTLAVLARKLFRPAEPYRFWDYHFKGFSTPCRDLLQSDVSTVTKQRLQSVLAKTLTPKRDRLLVKLTGWPRIGFLREVFDDARFVHVMRDGRAVSNSMLNVPWWWGWRGPENWRWGTLAPAEKREWEAHGKSFVALAAIQWKILMGALEEAKVCAGEHSFCEVKYEEWCEHPIRTLNRVLEFCELDMTEEFKRSIRRFELVNTNYKWRKDLTPEQQNILEAVLRNDLQKHGYV